MGSPIPGDVVWVIAMDLLQASAYQAGVAVLTAYDGYMRQQDLCQLLKEDLHTADGVLSLTFGFSERGKTTKTGGGDQPGSGRRPPLAPHFRAHTWSPGFPDDAQSIHPTVAALVLGHRLRVGRTAASSRRDVRVDGFLRVSRGSGGAAETLPDGPQCFILSHQHAGSVSGRL